MFVVDDTETNTRAVAHSRHSLVDLTFAAFIANSSYSELLCIRAMNCSTSRYRTEAGMKCSFSGNCFISMQVLHFCLNKPCCDIFRNLVAFHEPINGLNPKMSSYPTSGSHPKLFITVDTLSELILRARLHHLHVLPLSSAR